MSAARHVAICGAGAVGLATAHYLLERGHRVTILDRGGPDHDCCSLGNAGFISPSHFVPLASPGIVGKALGWMGDPESPFYVRPRLDPEFLSWGIRFWRASRPARARSAAPLLRDLNLASRALFIALAEKTGNEFALCLEGLIMLVRSKRGLREETELAARSRELGMPAEVLDSGRLAALEPGLTLDVRGGVHYPLDAHLTPQRLMATLARLVREGGGSFRWNAEVHGWRFRSGTVEAARTVSGDIEADEFVVAAGSWTPLLVHELGVRLSLQPGKGYSLTLEAPRERPKHPLILQEARVAVTPMGPSLRVGGTMELTGIDLTINPPRIRGLTRSLSRYLSAFRPEDFASCAPWCGLRPCTPDGLPYIGRPRGWRNLLVATGHAMMGVSMAPITGKLVSEIISGDTTSIEISALSPDRYA